MVYIFVFREYNEKFAENILHTIIKIVNSSRKLCVIL